MSEIAIYTRSQPLTVKAVQNIGTKYVLRISVNVDHPLGVSVQLQFVG